MGDGWQPVHTCDDLDDFAATKCNIFDVDEKRTQEQLASLVLFKSPIPLGILPGIAPPVQTCNA